MKMNKLIEIYNHDECGYKGLMSYGEWRVAILNYTEKYRAENITYLQKHDDTDEVFVLLSGECILFAADGDDTPGKLTAQKMKPGKIYNIKRGVWHTHVLAPGAKVLVVENDNTSDANSPKYFDISAYRSFFDAGEG